MKNLLAIQQADDPKLAALAAELIVAAPDPELANELQIAITRVLSGEKSSVPVPDELVTKINNSDAFQFVRRQPTRNKNQSSPWRTLQDSQSHQEILFYRIKWFGGGGNWSGWMVAGVNDMNEQLNRQHWNCFYDHQHEYLEILTNVGKLSKRRDYLIGTNPIQPDKEN